VSRSKCFPSIPAPLWQECGIESHLLGKGGGGGERERERGGENERRGRFKRDLALAALGETGDGRMGGKEEE
jgi:hypothetical protein